MYVSPGYPVYYDAAGNHVRIYADRSSRSGRRDKATVPLSDIIYFANRTIIRALSLAANKRSPGT